MSPTPSKPSAKPSSTPQDAKSNKPLKRFRIYPDSGWPFFTVFVWKTREAMYRHQPQSGTDYNGLCRTWETYRGNKGDTELVFTGNIGEIHFLEECFTMGIITHECCHAALHFFRFARKHRLINLRPSTDNPRVLVGSKEEAFCWVLGNIARQVVWGYDKGRASKATGCITPFPPIRKQRITVKAS